VVTQEKLKDLFRYDAESGDFYWLTSGKGRVFGVPAGTITNHGYRSITIDFKRYVAHRLVWLWHNGYLPGELDHINRKPADNRIENLREVTHSENLWNSKTRSDNTSGVRGVCWDKQKSKWKVQVGPPGNRVQKHFVSLEDAKVFAEACRP